MTTNMENLTTTSTAKKPRALWKAWPLLLCAALTLGNISCGDITTKDVMKQEQKVEKIKSRLEAYIKARENEANKYNDLLAELATATTDQKKKDIKLSLSGIYETIVEYDKTIQELYENRWDAEKVLTYYTAEAGNSYAPNTPIDPHRRDHLLR